MSKILTCALVTIIFLSLASAEVLEFTDANFESEISQHDIALAEFYAPW